MKVPGQLLYSEEHEWVRVDGGGATVGVTDYAQSELGDIVYVELPQMDQKVTRGQVLGVVESVKAVSDIFAPVGGMVTSTNEKLRDNPELVNQSPYDQGWLACIKLESADELEALMSAEQYKEFVQKEKGS